jgi:hypothetical protein
MVEIVHVHFDIQFMPLAISVRYVRLLRYRVGFIGLSNSNYYYYYYYYYYYGSGGGGDDDDNNSNSC